MLFCCLGARRHVRRGVRAPLSGQHARGGNVKAAMGVWRVFVHVEQRLGELHRDLDMRCARREVEAHLQPVHRLASFTRLEAAPESRLQRKPLLPERLRCSGCAHKTQCRHVRQNKSRQMRGLGARRALRCTRAAAETAAVLQDKKSALDCFD